MVEACLYDHFLLWTCLILSKTLIALRSSHPGVMLQPLCTPYRAHAVYIYCRVPARRGLQQTAWAVTRHGARDNRLDKNF